MLIGLCETGDTCDMVSICEAASEIDCAIYFDIMAQSWNSWFQQIGSYFKLNKTPSEILDRLEIKIINLEKNGRLMEKRRKSILCYWTPCFIGLYVLLAILYYYMYIEQSQYWTLNLLVLPISAIVLKFTISWYYSVSLKKNESELVMMRHEKKKILEGVMNTKTYKVAKDILDKYGVPEEKDRQIHSNSLTKPPLTLYVDIDEVHKNHKL